MNCPLLAVPVCTVHGLPLQLWVKVWLQEDDATCLCKIQPCIPSRQAHLQKEEVHLSMHGIIFDRGLSELAAVRFVSVRLV